MIYKETEIRLGYVDLNRKNPCQLIFIEAEKGSGGLIRSVRKKIDNTAYSEVCNNLQCNQPKTKGSISYGHV